MKKIILYALTLVLFLPALASAIPPASISSCGTDINNATSLNWQLTSNITVTTNSTCLDVNTSNVNIDCNGFTILADDATANRGPAINITAPYVTLHGCIIQGFNYFDTDFFSYHGKAIMVNASNFTLYNTSIYNSYYPVYFGFASGATVNHTFFNVNITNQSDNAGAAFKSEFGSDSVANTTFYNIFISNFRSYGFFFQNIGSGVKVFNSTFNAIPSDIVSLGSGSSIEVYNNNFTSIGGAAITSSGTNARIYSNFIYNYSASAMAISGANAIIYNNTFRNNTGTSVAAIQLSSGGSGAQIYNNTFENYQTDPNANNPFTIKAAITASGVMNVSISDNTFRNATRGIVAVSNANITSFRDTHISPVSYEYTSFSGTGFFTAWSTINVINSTYRVNSSGLNVTNNGTINVQQPMNVSIYNNGALAANANISILNTNQVEVINVTANSNGYALVNLTYLKFNETGSVNYTPHNFTYDNGTLILYNSTEVTLQSAAQQIEINNAPAGDSTGPTITINDPTNNTNQSSTTLTLNFSATDISGLSTCWYSVNRTTNISIAGCTNTTSNQTSITVTAGLNQNITVYANDSLGNLGSATKTFNIDTTAPTITINSPANDTNQTSTTLTLNFSAVDTMPLSSCWYSVNGTTNFSVAGCVNTTTNQTSVTVTTGVTQNVTVYVNDSLGNIASSTRFFHIDTIGPSITVNSPVNNTNQSTNNLTINISVVDTTGISSCWYSINSTTNTTIAGCVNSTTNQTSVNVSLTSGQNITIYANDTLGNLASTIRFFNVNTSTPQITNVANATTSTTGTITWTTDVPANSTISYGTTTALGSSETSTSYDTSHSITITGLTASTMYYYNVTSCNVYTTCNTTGPYNFTTNASSSSGGSGGGSGGSGSASTTTSSNVTASVQVNAGETAELPNFEETNQNPRIAAQVNSKVKFKIAKREHTATIEKIIGLKVTLTLRSDPITITMSAGEQKTFDLDADKKDDVVVKVISVTGQTVVFEINPINVVPKPAAIQTPVSTPVQTVQPEIQQEIQQVVVTSKPAPQQSPILPIIVIAVVLAILAYWQIKLRNKPAIVTNYASSKKKTKR